MNNSEWMPRINSSRCIGCERCVLLCPTHALGKRNGKAALVEPDVCTYCVACEDVCPTQAIELPFLISHKSVKGSHHE